ncbi:hypothetical protein FA95DRAFT_1514613, partial [Auriscalpium vulgare]
MRTYGPGFTVSPSFQLPTAKISTDSWHGAKEESCCLHWHETFASSISRLVVAPLRFPLESFTSTKQLCAVISDAVKAHAEAYTQAHILHRDVSSSTIRFDECGRGFLIDWDLPKLDILAASEPRRQWRTGTWQFISGAILMRPAEKEHGLSDDLESFCHVLVYNLVKHRPTKFPQLYSDIDSFFDKFVEMYDGTIVGGAGKVNFFFGGQLHTRGFKGCLPIPCIEAVEALRALFKRLYDDSEDVPSSKNDSEDVPSSKNVQDIFNTSLDSSRDKEWWVDDHSEYIREAYPPSKRKRDDEEVVTAKKLFQSSSSLIQSSPSLISVPSGSNDVFVA